MDNSELLQSIQRRTQYQSDSKYLRPQIHKHILLLWRRQRRKMAHQITSRLLKLKLHWVKLGSAALWRKSLRLLKSSNKRKKLVKQQQVLNPLHVCQHTRLCVTHHQWRRGCWQKLGKKWTLNYLHPLYRRYMMHSVLCARTLILQRQSKFHCHTLH